MGLVASPEAGALRSLPQPYLKDKIANRGGSRVYIQYGKYTRAPARPITMCVNLYVVLFVYVGGNDFQLTHLDILYSHVYIDMYTFICLTFSKNCMYRFFVFNMN